MPAEKQSLTFISYSRNNKDFALELAKELRASGFAIWFDLLDIPTGARWDDEIEKALERCAIFMVILTPSSIISDNVKDEIGYAIDSEKRILPILLKDAKIPLRLRRFQYVDFTDVSYNEGIERAKQLLKELVDEPVRSVPELRPADVQGEPSTVNRSEELQADAHRLAQRKAEAIRKAREQEQRERQVQAPHRNQSFEKSVSQPNHKQSPARLYSIIVGIPLVALLCFGGGWSAWKFLIPPSTPITAMVTPIIVTPTFTPMVTVASGVTIESVSTTPAPLIPATVQTVIDYWNYRSAKRYDLAWEILSTTFQKNNHKGKYENYLTSREKDDYCEIKTENGREISSGESSAVVLITVKFYVGACPGTEARYDYQVTVVFDPETQRWRFDKLVEVNK